MNYSHNFGSNFPKSPIAAGTKKDIDDSVKDLILQYYALQEIGNTAAAAALYQENKETLEPYILDSAYFNLLEEELYNVGLTALTTLTTIVSDTEPVAQTTNSHWLKEW
ncbi:MAG: hypothetical protein IJ405_03710 [Lachnospiraceae bacterium]|nr:hypothetical protein [Lachnospiraceae bacterium]